MSVHVKSGQSFFIPFTNRIKTTGNLGGTAGDDSPVPIEAETLLLGQGFFNALIFPYAFKTPKGSPLPTYEDII